MFEALEKVMERESRKLHPSVADPVIVKKFDDIRNVISQIDPRNNNTAAEITINADMSLNEDGKNLVYRVSAPSRSKSKREMILEGMEILKRQKEVVDNIEEKLEPVEVNGVPMKPPVFGRGDKSRAWVDPLIKHWLGAYRNGLLICWDIEGYHYEYDIFEHQLSRSKIETI